MKLFYYNNLRYWRASLPHLSWMSSSLVVKMEANHWPKLMSSVIDKVRLTRCLRLVKESKIKMIGLTGGSTNVEVLTKSLSCFEFETLCLYIIITFYKFQLVLSFVIAIFPLCNQNKVVKSFGIYFSPFNIGLISHRRQRLVFGGCDVTRVVLRVLI